MRVTAVAGANFLLQVPDQFLLLSVVTPLFEIVESSLSSAAAAVKLQLCGSSIPYRRRQLDHHRHHGIIAVVIIVVVT